MRHYRTATGEHREPDAARVTGEGPGKGPRARALLSARLLHHFRRSAAGRNRGRVRKNQ